MQPQPVQLSPIGCGAQGIVGAVCLDVRCLPTNGFSIKPLRVKLLAEEQKATEEKLGLSVSWPPEPGLPPALAYRVYGAARLEAMGHGAQLEMGSMPPRILVFVFLLLFSPPGGLQTHPPVCFLFFFWR